MTPRWLIRRAWRCLRQRPRAFVLRVLAFALLGFLAGGSRVASRRADDLLPQLGGSVHVIAYLEDAMDEERARALAERVRRIPGVEAVVEVTASEALSRLRAALGDRPSGARVLDGVEEGFLPRSLEIRLSPSASIAARGQALAAQLQRIEGVAEVDAMAEGIARLRALADVLRVLGHGLSLFALITGLVVVCTVLVAGRQKQVREAEVLVLLGATPAAIRAPMILGTACAALVGAVLAAGLVWLGAFALEAALLPSSSGVPAVVPAWVGVPLAAAELAVGAGALVVLGLILGRLLGPRGELRRA